MTQRLAGRLAEWRRAEDLTQAAAARLLSVHATTYHRWEAGRRPYPRHLGTIAEVLGEDLATVSRLAGPAPRRRGRPAPADAPPLMRARLAAGLNRAELGRALHVGPATVYQWERGKTRPPSDVLPRLAVRLGLTREALDEALADHPPSRYDGEVLPGLGMTLRRHGWPRNQVQDLLDVAPTTVFEWETGRTRVPTWALRRLAAAVGADLDALVSAGRRKTAGPAGVPTLATLRKRARMIQREAAAVLGVSVSTLGRYETGRRPVGLPLACAMAQVYRVPLPQVLAAAGLTPPPMLRRPHWTADQLPAVLTDLRQAAGASLSQVARCAGVSQPTVRRWETGDSAPSPGALATLELHYRVQRGGLTRLRSRSLV
jgi:transcriptional regulator with XRE-family HTH domain